MELKLEEQTLVMNYRRLDQGGKKELLDFAAYLLKKQKASGPKEGGEAENQCTLDARQEERPEAAKEPIFTE